MSTILVIDDEPVIRELMLEILAEDGHRVIGAGDARSALGLVENEEVALVVSDIIMPGLTGLELLEHLRSVRPSLPVVMVTGAGTHGNLSEALAGGADGLVMKPFTHADLKRAVMTALDRASRSESELRRRLLTPTLAGALANAIEAREPSLHGHCERLAGLAVRIAEELGLPDPQIETVRLGAILHDVGKIGIPDRILLKPGPFEPDELELMRTHPLVGDRLLAPLDLLEGVRPVVRCHHERWDGTGYPEGLAGEAIPITARVVAVADAIEAMSARRRYREPMAPPEIVGELRGGRGTQWDPAVVDVALRLIDDDALRFGAAGLELRDRPAGAQRARLHSVLLVEDDLDHAAITRQRLEEIEDVTVCHAPDVATARELCRGSRWSLVVLDNRLPDGTGLDVLAHLREHAPGVPVVMLTGEGSESVAVEAFRQGASDCVVKRNGYAGEVAGRVRALLAHA